MSSHEPVTAERVSSILGDIYDAALNAAPSLSAAMACASV
jgi:hypothetical protein